MYSVNEVSKISGISKRTLHYYDSIGLLSPKKNENKYRVYLEEDIKNLQQILTYKTLGFNLKEIQKMLNEQTDKLEIFKKQRQLLLKEKERLNEILNGIERAIEQYDKGVEVTMEERFNGFSRADMNKYEKEAIEKYGKESIEESKKLQSGKEDEMFSSFNNGFKNLSNYRSNSVSVEEEQVQIEIEKLYKAINKYGFSCSVEVFSSIGMGYVADERFKNNIDKFGDGTAEYTNDAIQYYCLNKVE